MSAEYLRETARMIRETAEADVTPSPWGVAGVDGMGFAVHRGEHDTIALYASRPDAMHIAAWHPKVALAVADWLDSVAGRFRGGQFHQVKEHDVVSALRVARTWRGEQGSPR